MKALHFLILVTFLITGISVAQIPEKVNYQGVLTDPSGNPIPNGNYNLTFRIYGSASGGSAVWTETQNTTITNGIFNVQLGDVTSIGLAFDTPYWLSIQVGTDTELSPRIEMTSAAYSYNSISAEGLQGRDVSSTAPTNGQVLKWNGSSWTPDNDNSGGPPSGAAGGDLSGSYPNPTVDGIQGRNVSSTAPASGQVLKWNGSLWAPGTDNTGTTVWNTSGNDIYNANSGNVGIGTNSPDAKLDVLGDSYFAGNFKTNYLSTNTHVVQSEFTGSGNYDAVGIYGISAPNDGYGYGGRFDGGYMGVYAIGYGATYSGSAWGVYGEASGTVGTRYGVYGHAHGDGTGSRYGIYGYSSGSGTTNYAGRFNGNVSILGNLSKSSGSFKIDHPLDPANKYLYHSFVESPDMKNIYDGVVVLNANGEAWITLPEWFQALNKDFRYQLTCIGGYAPVYVAEKISDNRFKISGGRSGLEVSWQVTGIRKDAYAEKYRIPVEELKPINERGKYLHPDVFGMPETSGVDYELLKEAEDHEKGK